MLNAERFPIDDGFLIIQHEMDWLRPAFWESIFSLSNGLLGMRGSLDEPMPGTPSRPMTFMAGLYNTLPKGLPELPILPDGLTARIMLAGSTFDLRLGRTTRFTRWLDMKRGLLCRQVTWRDDQGRTTDLRFLRLLSLADRQLAAVRIEVAPVDWSGPVEVAVRLAMPGRAGRKPSHWRPARVRSDDDGVFSLATRTRQTRRPLVAAAACDVGIGSAPIRGEAAIGDESAGQVFRADVQRGETLRCERFVAFIAGEAGERAPIAGAHRTARSAREHGFEHVLDAHVTACARMWDAIDVEVDGPADDQRAIRFNLFQLATLCPPPNVTASVGPKGLSGTHYLGHVFWDTEIYMLPFFTATHPEGARRLLMYRHATLDGARKKARDNGYRGAQYAWESADTGDEACPRFLPDPQGGPPVRIWCGEIQDHITADVAYAIDAYVRATGDCAFLHDCGAEILFETARFWASRASRDEAGQYVIRDGMGPDEFHVHVDNDAFTNYLAHWNLTAAAELIESPSFPGPRRAELIESLKLGPNESNQWREVAGGLVLSYDEDTGFIEQSDGFRDRPDVSPDILRIPRRVPITDLLGAGLVIDAQVLKQAEVVIMQCLLADRFDQRSREVNFDYYEPRTSHDSSLSVSAHAWAAARLGRASQAYDFVRRAALLDLHDLAGNTADGLHTANMGGVWLAIAFGFAGLNLDGDAPTVSPCLPQNWERLRFRIHHRGHRYTIDCGRDHASVNPL